MATTASRGSRPAGSQKGQRRAETERSIAMISTTNGKRVACSERWGSAR